MLTKKIISILISVVLILLITIPIASADFVTQLPFMAFVEQNTVHFDSEGIITEIYKTESYEPYAVKNGDDIRIYLNSPFTVATSSTALAVKYSFPDASYIEGQSYNLSFTVSSETNTNYIYSYCNTINWSHNIIMGMNLIYANRDFYVGDTTFAPWQVDRKFSSLMNNYDENFLSLCVTTANAYVTSFSQDYTFNVDFCVDDEYSKSDNSIFFYFYFTTYGSNKLYYLNDFTLSPVGATKSLFSEEEYQQGILSGINQTNDKLDDTNSKLDDILNLPDQEYDFGTEQGAEGVDNLVGAIDDKGPGFFSAIGNLITTVSYSGTDAKWTFPALKIPKISNIVPEIKLSEETEIDFNYWINKIPDKILSTIRYVLTIALICFCFYELYDTIEESLKGKEKKNP